MGFIRRRLILPLLLSSIFLLYLLRSNSVISNGSASAHRHRYYGHWWKEYAQDHPVTSMIPLPTQSPADIPTIQYDFGEEEAAAKAVREKRRDAIKSAFLHSWNGYKKHAWGMDEVGPLTGKSKDTFGGWGATLIDSLDTLWIMGLKKEFEEAVVAVSRVDFSATETLTLNIFEITIRYLGGLLAAHDLTKGAYPVLLEKAIDLGDLLYIAFDTPNRMPVLRWFWLASKEKRDQDASNINVLAELGSLSVEFTRLTQLTGDPKYYDAIQRITNVLDKNQDYTALPGLWPISIDALTPNFMSDNRFSFGGLADSLYEYLPKEYLMLGGRSSQYRTMYEKAIHVAKKHMFFRPMTENGDDILISGTVRARGRSINLEPDSQHLTCFAGGMVAIGSKIFDRPDELDIAKKLVEGCIWAYKSMPSGVMPEAFRAVPCFDEHVGCSWKIREWLNSEDDDQQPIEELKRRAKERGIYPGFKDISSPAYHLRPEAIESVFILYRITGDTSLHDKGWEMFTAIDRMTKTQIGYGAVEDVTAAHPTITDEMESFWTGETLKYFYLLFSEPDVISLDKYIFNTEAHPLLRPT
ncbi:alpha-1,2-Mannosidase [Trichophyton interdigitale]|uniref:alpha-1,2-Mannosidase n=1 Tax=Trichophyton interdigitale TaxID=101480 RepID=A0A9P4YKZ1_9EURO|nr:alpha-1,2-Mannosidase [Trichophyton interdigitale]KAF3898633.1 alpha-1,2-Mannosidase [Trichophyton interdigitale]KAG8210244.1 alpha-1,2-Mannosidase [Trichophyton interdigitale]